MEQNSTLFYLYFIIRIVGAIVCYNQGKWLNRGEKRWIVLGFCSPIICMIWVFCLSAKPIEKISLENKKKPFTRYYTENGVIEVENEGDKTVTINGVIPENGRYELNHFESIEVVAGKVVTFTSK